MRDLVRASKLKATQAPKKRRATGEVGLVSANDSPKDVREKQARVIRSMEWMAVDWVEYLQHVERQGLQMFRLQDVATKMALHINTIRNLYDPLSDGFDPAFPTPVKLTNAPKSKAMGFIEWEIEAYLIGQITRCRGIHLSVVEQNAEPNPTTGRAHSTAQEQSECGTQPARIASAPTEETQTAPAAGQQPESPECTAAVTAIPTRVAVHELETKSSNV